MNHGAGDAGGADCALEMACIRVSASAPENNLRQELIKRGQVFSRLLDSHVVRVTSVSLDPETGDERAMVRESIFRDPDLGFLRIEKERFAYNLSDEHASSVLVAFWFATHGLTIWRSYSFENGQVIKQPPRIRLYRDVEQTGYQAWSPFFGRLFPNVPNFVQLVKSLEIDPGWVPAEPQKGAARPSRTVRMSGRVGKYGKFAIEFGELGESKYWLPVRFTRTLVQGDTISGDRQLGVVHDRADDPRLLVFEEIEWRTMEYDLTTTPPRIVSATRTDSNRRGNGEERTFHFKYRFDYDRLPNDVAIKPGVWETRFLQIPNGWPAEVVPPEQKRFEYIDGEVVLVVDKRAADSLEEVTFSEPKTPGYFWLAVIVSPVLVVAVLALFIYVRSSVAVNRKDRRKGKMEDGS